MNDTAPSMTDERSRLFGGTNEEGDYFLYFAASTKDGTIVALYSDGRCFHLLEGRNWDSLRHACSNYGLTIRANGEELYGENTSAELRMLGDTASFRGEVMAARELHGCTVRSNGDGTYAVRTPSTL